MPRARALRQRTFHNRNLLHIPQPFDSPVILLDHRANSRLLGEHLDRNLDLGLDLQLRPHIANAYDEILQNRHLRLRRQIKLHLIRLRISRQCN